MYVLERVFERVLARVHVLGPTIGQHMLDDAII
jgi:hypothetical protein